MSNPLVYIDQNIVGLILDGQLKLSPQSEFSWVYSKEHFSEIRRSDNAEKYLSVFESIDAKLLELELDSAWKITGQARLLEHGEPHEHYQAYIEAVGEADVNEGMFDPFQAWVNGGGDEGSLRELPEKLAQQVLTLINETPTKDALLLHRKLDRVHLDYAGVIEQLIEQGNDISKTRKVLGDDKGAIGNLKGKNQVQRIWEIIGPACPGITCDQFFGFDPVDKQGYESWPIYLGIVGCCSVMDIVGFQAEKKCRKIGRLPNIRSDAGHIAMGAFCSAIFSEDKRLIKRAKAIYEYKDIWTQAVLIERAGNK